MKKLLIGILGIVAFVSLAACDEVIPGGQDRYGVLIDLDSIEVLNESDARRELESFVNTINPDVAELARGVDTNFHTEADILPDIETDFPIVLEGTNQVTAEIFVSPEKAGTGMDGLFITLAESFNAQNLEINGQTVSVSIRDISSGVGLDYILAGVHIPDGFSPSNDVWAQLMSANNVNFNVVAGRTVGDVSGLVMRESIYDSMIANHGEISIASLIDAIENDGVLLGYANPFVSSTGLDLLVHLMNHFDSNNPVSESAISQLHDFQSNIPASFFNTLQMREAARSGSIDVMSMAHHTFINTPELSGFTFVPINGRQDSPMYTFSDNIEAQIVEMFTEYILTNENQQIATDHGFNAFDDHPHELDIEDRLVSAIQRTWRENRDGDRPTVAVFISDVSGSMQANDAIGTLRNSLLNSMSYINDTTYVGLVSYSTDVQIDLPIGLMDQDHRSYFIGAVQQYRPQGSTATFDAVMVGIDMLLEHMENDPNVRPILFVLSDGETNRGVSLYRVAPIVQSIGIPIVTIGFNGDFPELRQLSEINESISIDAINDNLMYQLRSLFNVGM